MKLYIALCLGVLSMSCNSHGSSVGLSHDATQAESIGALVTRFTLENDAIIVADTSYSVDDIWIEKLWKYVEGKPEVLMGSSSPKYHLQINFDKSSPRIDTYRKSWELRLDNGIRFRPSGDYSIVASMSELPNDTLYVDVHRLDRPFSKASKRGRRYKIMISK